MERLTENQIANLLAENEQLKDKAAVLQTKLNNTKEELQLAKQGLGMANLDSLPKEVVEDARRRIAMGLTEAQAIHKALEQHSHDKRNEPKPEAEPAKPVLPTVKK